MKISFVPMKLSLILLMLLSLSACQTIDVRGQYVDEKDLQRITVGSSSKEEVTNLIGTPTYIPEFSQDSTWYYMQRSLKRRAFLSPKSAEQRIVKIVFDRTNRVKSVEVLSNTQNDGLPIRSEATPVYGTEQGVIKKFVKNMGQYTPSAKEKTRKKPNM